MLADFMKCESWEDGVKTGLLKKGRLRTWAAVALLCPENLNIC